MLYLAGPRNQKQKQKPYIQIKNWNVLTRKPLICNIKIEFVTKVVNKSSDSI